jgi:hypothetical protein
MQFPLRTKFTLMSLLILLNFILRYPIILHEIGWDSFAVHITANIVSTFGYAVWWIHPASVIGSYPYSMPSAVPFILSGISQCISVDMERVIWLFCIIIGLFSIFTAYLMAGAIWNNDLLKFLVAFVFSTAQGVVTFSTWTVTTRGLFVMLLPLFVYLLLKTRTFIMRYSLLTFAFIILLLSTHHYVYFIAPIVISFFVVAMFYKLGEHLKLKIPNILINSIILASFLAMFLRSYFYRDIMEFERGFGGSWYSFVWEMPQDWIRYVGILVIFTVSGYTYLLLKPNKRFGEWFLLLVLIGFAPLLYVKTYIKWILPLLAALLIGISLINIANVKTHTEKKKYVPTFLIVILLLLSVSFTGYYQYLHFLNDPSPDKRHMEERTYVGALWIKDNIGNDKNMLAGPYILHRVLSISEVPTLTGARCSDLAYGFVDPGGLQVEQIYSPLSPGFYYQDPYRQVNQTGTEWYVDAIADSDITKRGSRAWRLIPKFNLSYFVENKDRPDTFTRSVQQTKDSIYDNGKISIWDLGK